MIKRCTKCGNEYPATSEYFYNKRASGEKLRSWCRKCCYEATKSYRENNPEKKSVYNKKYWEKNKDYYKEYHREYMRKISHSEKGPRLQFMKNIHKYIRRNKPMQKYCSICNEEKKLELSNISGLYKRDINDYQWLCNSCHRLYDKLTQTHKLVVR